MLKKTLGFFVLTAMAASTWAAETTLQLPAKARIDVQVIDVVRLDQQTPDRQDVLLRPVSSSGSQATHRLPHYCLITADARLEDQRVRLTTQSVTCIETNGDEREIFSGELSAAAFEPDAGYGLDVCTRQQSGQCAKAVIEPDHYFQLQLGKETQLPALANPSEEINRQRQHADDTSNAP